MDKVCDGRLDCADKSDEVGCKMVNMDSSYMSSIPPGSTKMGSNLLDVNVTLTIESVLDISEVNSMLEIPFRLDLSWIEPRISFVNLKEGSNILSLDQLTTLWLPVLSLPNTKEKLSISFNDETTLGYVTSLDISKGAKAPLHILRNDVTFKGADW